MATRFWSHGRTRTVGVLGASVLLVATIVATMGSAAAAATRYEGENATIFQGVVESNHAGFSGTGFVNSDNSSGSYVEWSVTAPNAGTATLGLRYANGTTVDRPMTITVNGVAVASDLSFAGTGAWTTWVTKNVTATVNAGTNVIRATGSTVNGGPNIDFLDVDVAAPSTDYQAEDATITLGVVESNHTGFTGTGFVNFDNVVGSAIQWTITSAVAGSASLTLRYANGTTVDRPMDIAVNGTVVAAARSFPGTTNWDTWSTQTLNVTLNAGANTVRATATTANGGPNLDRLSVGAALDTTRPTAPGQPVCSNIGETTITLTWGASTDNVGIVAYDIFHDGTQIDTAPGNATTRGLTGLQANFTYRLSVFGRDAAGNVSNTSPLATCQTLPINDPNPPTAPGQPSFSAVGQTSVNLSWGASSDDRAVTAYLIRNSATNAVLFTVAGNPPATSTTVPGLTCNTTYTLHIVARDAAGNLSSPSPNTTPAFTTTACSRGVPQTPTTVSSTWSIPWDICWLPGRQEALVTERDTFRVFRLTLAGVKTQVGTVPGADTTDGEGGLLGCAPSPTWNGTSDSDVFFMHTSPTDNRVVRMTYNGTSLSTTSTAIITGIRRSRFHNGGRLKFGPDGFLYVSTGESQQPNLAQDLNSLNGKILRVTKTGAAAPGNPFGTRVYSYGHRNPQGLAWDTAGRLWESEFGNATWDEVNLILPGRNYGWPTCEGTCGTAGLENPKWQQAVNVCSCSGIAIVNDTLYMGALRGTRLWRLELTGTTVGTSSSYFVGTFGRIRSVEKIPGVNALWFGTSNADNNGGQADGSDAIRRTNIQ
jgi:glucose/arabinose dehydrogenase